MARSALGALRAETSRRARRRDEFVGAVDVASARSEANLAEAQVLLVQ